MAKAIVKKIDKRSKEYRDSHRKTSPMTVIKSTPEYTETTVLKTHLQMIQELREQIDMWQKIYTEDVNAVMNRIAKLENIVG